jgi:hypothetical protein
MARLAQDALRSSFLFTIKTTLNLFLLAIIDHQSV